MSLDKCTLKNTVKFTITGEYPAKVLKVYDGDTITCAFDFGLGIRQMSVRLEGIDTPEIRGSGKNEKEFAYRVKNELVEKIMDDIVILRCNGFDKYGRLLAEVIQDGKSINDWLIKNEYAHQYDGGKKIGFSHLD